MVNLKTTVDILGFNKCNYVITGFWNHNPLAWRIQFQTRNIFRVYNSRTCTILTVLYFKTRERPTLSGITKMNECLVHLGLEKLSGCFWTDSMRLNIQVYSLQGHGLCRNVSVIGTDMKEERLRSPEEEDTQSDSHSAKNILLTLLLEENCP